MDELGRGTVRIAVVEDDAATREALTAMLARVAGLDVVASFGSGEAALALAQSGSVQPDVLLVDIGLPGMSGIELVSRLAVAVPGLRFLMLTLSGDSQDIFNALRAGAHGYVLKGGTAVELHDAIRDACDGGMPFSVGVARRVREFFMRQPAPVAEDSQLSPREAEALSLMARGMLRKEVAAEMCVTEHTVRTYLKRIYTKLNVRTSRAAVAVFMAHSQDGHPRSTPVDNAG